MQYVDASSEAGVKFPLIYVNKAFLRTTGYTWEEIINRNCRFLQGPLSEPESIAALSQGLQNGVTVRVEITNYRKDASLFRNLIALRPVIEYASVDDARAKTGGVYRFVLGVQFEATSDSMVEERILELDTLIKLLPGVIITPTHDSNLGGSGDCASSLPKTRSNKYLAHISRLPLYNRPQPLLRHGPLTPTQAC